MDYEGDVRINENSLDVEWLEQPELMRRYTHHSAVCHLDMDKEKVALDLVKAELDKRVRSNPGGFGLEKITEGAIVSAIVQAPVYQKAHQKFLEARFEHEVSQGVVRSIDQKCKALENLVKLHGQSYFAGPVVPRDLSKERTAARESRDRTSNRAVKVRVKDPSTKRRKG